MLLPSDVARLVLGYLQQEGLTATSRAFIFESPNLKEYAEHSSEDGVIPACVFSLFGKNLITILNEYVAVKAKETAQENHIPVVMTSLWKKLDFTLNQIKSMQNSPAVQLNQRLRTKHHIQMTRQQRSFCASPSPASAHLPETPSVTGQCVLPSMSTPQGMLGHSTPVSYTSQYTRPSTLCLTQPGESPLQILVPDHRLNPGPLSPARRKCDSPRRRGGGQLGASGTSRSTLVSSSLVVETANEENVAENLSQIVIENAREKILNDRSLQEKLAENINKILASDNSPQTLKAACSTVEQEQSIDEILGLQGEIHMTDDAIQDILTQTESDPAFQALFDLFDYGKSKAAEGSELADGSLSTSAQESDETGHIDSAPETGTGQDDSRSVGESNAGNLSPKTSESKSKKKSPVIRSVSKSSSTALQPRIVKQAATVRGHANSKKGLVRAGVLSGNKQTRGATSTTKLNNKVDSCPPDQTVSSSSFTEETVAMEMDDPQEEISETVNVQNPTVVHQESQSQSQNDQISQVPVKSSQVDMTAIQSKAVPSNDLTKPDIDISINSSDKMFLTPSCTQQTDSTHKETQPCSLTCVPPTAGSVTLPALASSAITSAPSTSLCVSDAQAIEPDPSKIVSLKIILSDEQDEQSSDLVLNQAVSSISGDRIPTIFLSSPAKSPAKTLPTASTTITQEETAQAVSSLQGVEGVGSFGTPARSVLTNIQAVARPAGQETGFIQLLPANPSFGPAGSYFIVTDPATAEQRSNVVLLPSNMPQGMVSSTPQLIATPPRQRTVVSVGQNISQAYSPTSAIIISSPVQPMLQNTMVPVSVVGQNTGKLTVLPNQMLSLQCSTSVRQPAKIISQPKLAGKENTDMGRTGQSGQVSKVIPQASQSSDQQKNASGTSPSHRRILRFDATPENTTAGQSSTQTTAPSSTTEQHKGNKQTEPNQPLVSDTNKRRIEPIRLPEVNHNAGKKDCEKASIPQQQTEAQKSKVNEKKTNQTAVSARSSNKIASEARIRQEPQKKSQPPNKDDKAVSQSAKSSAQGQKQKPAGNIQSSTLEEPCEGRLVKPAERSSSDKISLRDSPGVTANKENELEGGQQEQHQTAARPTEELVTSTAKPAAPVSSSSSKMLCKTSPLTKQAVEMLQGIQSQTPAATPPKRQSTSCPDIPLPRTPGPGHTQEEPTDGLRTPCRQRHGREGESTPRCLPPPATPDVPSCSPASEAGSENSINMAAHTLMILSRAARTGGPLKDSLRQEEASAGKSSISKGKKRKHVEPSPPAKKELQLSGSSGSKKKSKKQKKLLDSFPDDLDVDKFLSSLHYDE